jgi:DNA-directed RNA polymerase specialized sigma subunit
MTTDTTRRDKIINSYGFNPESFRQKQSLGKILEHLLDRQRNTYWLRAVCGEPWKDIGKKIGVSPQRAVEIFKQAERSMKKLYRLSDEQKLLLQIGLLK